MLARLVVSEPYQPTRRVLIRETPFWIGRDGACQLVLNHPSVSKRHAALHLRGEDYFIEDSGSKNGTLVNGLAAGGEALRHQDLITVGGLDLMFQEIRPQDLSDDLGLEFEKLRTALRLASEIRAAPQLESVLDQVMDGLMRLSQAERGFLLLRQDGGDLRMVRSVNISEDEYGRDSGRISRSAVQRAVESRRPLALCNAQKDTFFKDQPSVCQMKLKTLVSVPVLDGSGGVVGLLYADSSSREQGFTEMDVEVLRSLAESASMALESARLQAKIGRVLKEASEALAQVEELALDASLRLTVRRAVTSLQGLRLQTQERSLSAEPDSGLVHEG